MKNFLPLLLLITTIFSCKKDDNDNPSTAFFADSGGVYISNEGKFQAGNASVTYFNPTTNLVTENVYQQTNLQPLGDVFQSMSLINGKLYLVVNNSGKIVVCETYSMRAIKTISGLTSPRYILQVNNSKAYVSDLSSKNISVINLDNNTISSTITVTSGTEQMMKINNLVYVTNLFSEYLYIIDVNNDQLTDSIQVTVGGSSIVLDANGKLWVMCTGDFMGLNAALYKIDPATKTIENTFTFTSGEYPARLNLNPAGDSLYYVNGGIYKMSTADLILPSFSLISPPGFSFYGLSIDKNSNIIYATDPIDFTQRGIVYRYTSGGNAIDNFTAGVVPADFLFLE